MYQPFGVTRPTVAPTNASPTVTVRGLPGRLALAKPWRVARSWGFVPCAPWDTIGNGQLRAPWRSVGKGLLLTLRSWVLLGRGAHSRRSALLSPRYRSGHSSRILGCSVLGAPTRLRRRARSVDEQVAGGLLFHGGEVVRGIACQRRVNQVDKAMVRGCGRLGKWTWWQQDRRTVPGTCCTAPLALTAQAGRRIVRQAVVAADLAVVQGQSSADQRRRPGSGMALAMPPPRRPRCCRSPQTCSASSVP